MVRIITILLLIIAFQKSFAQEAEKTFYIGHSLINLNIPAMTHSLSLDAGIPGDDYDYQIGNGANLWYQWDTLVGNEQGTPYQDALPTGTYDNLIFTEAIALKGHIEWSYTYLYANNFCEYAHSFNPDTKMYVYETWHCTKSGTNEGCEWDPGSNVDWRQRLDDDLSLWEGIVDHVLTINPDYDVNIIPGGQGLAKLYDAIEDGAVPDKTNINQFFSDDIHLTNEGNYYIACIMFACVYERSPVGLSNHLKDEWGSFYPALDPALALKLQELAWETVCEYERSGVECSPASTSEGDNNKVFFDQNNQVLNFQKNYSGEVMILDIQGRMVRKINVENESLVKIGNLIPGVYFVKTVNNTPLKILIR